MSTTMTFTSVYRTADIYLCAIKAAREHRAISCSVHKPEWNNTVKITKKIGLIGYQNNPSQDRFILFMSDAHRVHTCPSLVQISTLWRCAKISVLEW